MRNKPIGILLAGSLALWCVGATAQTVYKSEHNGVTVYSSTPSTGAIKMTMEPLSMIVAPKQERAEPSKKSTAVSESVSTGQKNREAKRVNVLDEELQRERAALTESEKDLAAQDAVRNGDEKNYQRKLDRLQPFKDAVELHKKNIEAINKEMGASR